MELQIKESEKSLTGHSMFVSTKYRLIQHMSAMSKATTDLQAMAERAEIKKAGDFGNHQEYLKACVALPCENHQGDPTGEKILRSMESIQKRLHAVEIMMRACRDSGFVSLMAAHLVGFDQVTSVDCSWTSTETCSGLVEGQIWSL